MVSFTPRPFYHRINSTRYPLNNRLGGPQNRSGCFRRRKIYSALLRLQFTVLIILSEELKSGNNSLAIFSNVVLLPLKSSSQLYLLKQPQFTFFHTQLLKLEFCHFNVNFCSNKDGTTRFPFNASFRLIAEVCLQRQIPCQLLRSWTRQKIHTVSVFVTIKRPEFYK